MPLPSHPDPDRRTHTVALWALGIVLVADAGVRAWVTSASFGVGCTSWQTDRARGHACAVGAVIAWRRERWPLLKVPGGLAVPVSSPPHGHQLPSSARLPATQPNPAPCAMAVTAGSLASVSAASAPRAAIPVALPRVVPRCPVSRPIRVGSVQQQPARSLTARVALAEAPASVAEAPAPVPWCGGPACPSTLSPQQAHSLCVCSLSPGNSCVRGAGPRADVPANNA